MNREAIAFYEQSLKIQYCIRANEKIPSISGIKFPT